MWLILILLIAVVVLDKTKVLQYNTLFMSVMYVVGIPLLICGYVGSMISGILKLLSDFGLLSCISLAVNIMLALPIIIILIMVLIKLCRYPIDRNRFSGTDEEYTVACAKRQRLLMWICFPLLWVSAVMALAMGIYMVTLAAGSMLIMANPAFWLLCLITFGILLMCYVIIMAGVIGVPLFLCIAFCALTGIYMIITIAMTVTALYRIRRVSGYSKLKNAAMVFSMLIPIWSLISMIEISMKLREISKDGNV